MSYTLGNGLNVYHSYDSLGRSVGQWVCNGPAATNCSGGTQIYGTLSAWKGSQVWGQADTVLNQGVNFYYADGFNRITSRTVYSGTVNNYTYAYDRYGNRVSLQGGYMFNPTINAVNNHITTAGFTYDAAGNMTNDSVHSYTYDAEGNILKVDGGSTAIYTYDVFNHRIHVQTATATNEFVYDWAGRRVSTWLSPNNFGSEGRIYWDGQQIAYRSTDGTTYFDHQDTLGTERMRTTYSGAVGSTYASLPWGDGYTATVNTSGADQDNAHYAGLDHDAESGTEHAQFRNYASAQGRWLAPDPYAGSYDLTNPQSMNRYAYVLNNPLGLLDPLGLQCNGGQTSCDDGGDDFADSDYADAEQGDGSDVPVPTFYINSISFSPPDFSLIYFPPQYSVWISYVNQGNPIAPNNGTYTFRVNVIAKSAAGAVAAPATFCTNFPALCTLGTDITAVLEAIPPVAASVLLLNMEGDNSNSARCAQVRQQAIAACTDIHIGTGGRRDNSGAFFACIRKRMEAEGCQY